MKCCFFLIVSIDRTDTRKPFSFIVDTSNYDSGPENLMAWTQTLKPQLIVCNFDLLK